MRLSWLASLFGRSKPEPAAATAAGSRSTALKVDPSARKPGLAPARPLPSQGPPLRVETEPMTPPAAGDHAPLLKDPQHPPIIPNPPNKAGGWDRADDRPDVRDRLPARDRPEDEVVKTTKMPAQEELSLQLQERLKNVATILGSIDEKLAQQTRVAELVADRLQTLPRVLEGLVEAERMNLETLRDLRGSMERQGEAARLTGEKLDRLPGTVEGLGTKIDQQTQSAAAVRTSVETVGQSVRSLVDGAQRAQSSLITEFRRGQDSQQQRLENLVERQRRTMYIIAAIGVIVVVCLIVVLTRLPN